MVSDIVILRKIVMGFGGIEEIVFLLTSFAQCDQESYSERKCCRRGRIFVEILSMGRCVTSCYWWLSKFLVVILLLSFLMNKLHEISKGALHE